jgi:hypothetical protein
MKKNIFAELNEILDKIDNFEIYQIEIAKLKYKLVLLEIKYKEELRLQKDQIEKNKWGHDLWIQFINSF